MKSDFSDLRFTKADGTTLLDAWMESHTASTSAVIWVETNTPASTVEADIYMYYSNSGASSDWDGAGTFQFFENFESGVCSGDAGWTCESGTSMTKVSSPVKNGSCAGDYTTTDDWNDAYTVVGDDVGDMVYEFYARTSSTNYNVISIGRDLGSHINCVSLYFHDGYIKYHDGSLNNLQTCNINTWYRFEVTTRPSTNKFNIRINGVLKGIGLNARGSIVGGINCIGLTNDANDNLYIDMIFARKYASNPATYSVGSEEDAPPPAVMAIFIHHYEQMRRN